MDIEIKLDSNYNIPKVIIYTNKVTDEVNNILNNISMINSKKLTAFKDEKMYAQGTGGRRLLRRQLHCRVHEGGGERPCPPARPVHRDHPAVAAHRGPGDAVLLRRGEAGRRPLRRQLPGLSAPDEPQVPQAGPYLQRGSRVRVLPVRKR